MKTIPALTLLAAILAAPLQAAECPALLDYSMKPLRGEQPVNFCEAYRGKAILAVNTASQCGFTPQFSGLEALYKKYLDRGLVVLGFPSNDFWQEHTDAEQTAKVCYLNYGVTFPMFTKSAVRGDDANAFLKQLAAQSNTTPKWNFFKYLIDPSGKVVKAYPSTTKPDDEELLRDVEQVLAKVGKPGS